jgi:hypothetical protein
VETQTHPVGKTLFFLVFRILADGQVHETSDLDMILICFLLCNFFVDFANAPDYVKEERAKEILFQMESTEIIICQ